jgi:broad specificity phosphatase PhoE
MRIFLIRHGETTGDVEDRYGGDYEDHLSKKGIEQSLELGRILKPKNIKIIYHSPKIRASETAKILAEKINVKMISIKDIRERNSYGILTGLVKSEAKQKFPKEVEKLQKDKLNHNVKNSENYNFFKKRVLKAFENIFNSKYDVIAIVSHGGPISCFVREFLKLGEFKFLGDCAILELEKNNNQVTLLNLHNASLESD